MFEIDKLLHLGMVVESTCAIFLFELKDLFEIQQC